ncbi:MAG: hypothetical protein E7675_05085 [Ruminococcaceae bacterium]|nr:hypothetical protein [Oscillospiraceae bacterium]
MQNKELHNVAKGKAVLALGANGVSITNGIKKAESHWDGGVAPTFAIIDLGGYYTVSSIRLITFYGDGRYYHYEIYASVDGVDYIKISEKQDNEEATKEGVVHEFEPTNMRFIRILMQYNSANPSCHIVQCEAYGVENMDFEPVIHDFTQENIDNIAFGKPCRTNSNPRLSYFCTDGNINSYWLGEGYPKYADVDLLENYKLSSVQVYTPAGYDFKYSIYTSLDGVKFDLAAKGDIIDGEHADVAMNGVEARIIRTCITYSSVGPGGSAMISQIKAYGEKTGTKVIPTRKTLCFESYEEWLKKNCGVDISKLERVNGRYDIKKTYTEEDTKKALAGLVSRTVGEGYVDKFIFNIKDNEGGNYYRLKACNGKVYISADCGVSAAKGFGDYLRDYCHAQVTQQTKQVKMPEVLPETSEEIFVKSPYEVRYAYNYCTLSYTMPYFGYEEWQRELDFLMLSGVNLILDLTATEALWIHYLQKLGYTVDQAKDYVCGYCYKAWWLMGNLEGTCGNVGDAWVYDTLELARVNQRYMTVMGAMPALQTFVGAMPSTFGRLAKDHLTAKGFSDISEYMAPQGTWAGGFIRPNIVKTSYDGYGYLASEFYKSQDFIYGQNTDYYCGDVCHEGGIVPSDLSKPEMARKILDELMLSNNKARWILQAWWDNPMKETLDGFAEYRSTNVIILDLAALAKPRWSNTETWGGKEFGGCGWIFCMLDNYGGRTGMHGKLDKMSKLISEACGDSQLMKGIGITPEGTLGNPVVFELFWDMAWKDKPVDIDKWIKEYIVRRYGATTDSLEKAWDIFEKTLYGVDTYDGTTKNNIVNENPSLSKGYCTGPYFKTKYSRTEFEKGVEYFMENIEDFIDNEGYVYDAVDLMRQQLSNAADDYFEVLKLSVEKLDLEAYRRAKAKFLGAMELINEISAYSEDDRMGKWLGRIYDFINDERTGSYDDFDVDMMRINAKALVSSWASSPINNYGNRLYEGLITDYNMKMWDLFLNRLENQWVNGERVIINLASAKCFNIAWEMVLSDKNYEKNVKDPKGNASDRGLAAIWKEIKEKYLFTEEDNVDAKEEGEFITAAVAAQNKSE